jgi:hypothetical protein
MSRNARSVEPLKITSAKIDIAGLQQTLFVGVPRAGPAGKRQCQLKRLA